ncbi:MAG: pirin family protein [Candidatus Thorarchaeota archaeon]
MNFRKIKKIFSTKPTLEGAGVHLKRAFGFYDVPDFDPFLLLDDFHSNNPDDYMAGFPWHPHRGIETITYVFYGEVKHGDSLGNSGKIGAGEVQWMTAGSGIIHQEMPEANDGLWGVQLWANLPASHKMMDPRYRDVNAQDIPEVHKDNNKIHIKIIAGKIDTTEGPVKDIITEPEYLDIRMDPHSEFVHKIPKGHNAFAYILEGEAIFELHGATIKNEFIVLYKEGEGIQIRTNDKSVRFLLISGKPIGEPVAWRGPIVMNTQEELRVAFSEIQKGIFIKHSQK